MRITRPPIRRTLPRRADRAARLHSLHLRRHLRRLRLRCLPAASLAEPVTVDANVVLPIGTKVRGTIVTAQSAGKFKGNALLQLTLDSVSVNGTRYSIQTSEFEDAGKGRGKRTAIGAGGGAAFGAIIGAVAGGGKGAAIGALAGGGAGTAAAGFTGKKDIVLPAETRLHFKLVQPVSIQPGS
jgi:hypothetical protein